MTPQEVRQAVADQRLISGGGGGGVASNQAGYPSTQVGFQTYRVSGATDVSRWLGQMRGKQVGAEAAAYLRQAKAVLDAIGEPQQVSIRWIAGGPFNGAVRADQGGQALNSGGNAFANAELGVARMPAGPIEIRAWRGVGAFEANRNLGQTVAIGGPWAPLAMVHAWGGVSSDGGTTWVVPIRGRDGFEGSLELKFENSLPALEDWPQ
ncbi:MAG: hypothetical protein AAGK04_12030 [Planctomycetota bacterium]